MRLAPLTITQVGFGRGFDNSYDGSYDDSWADFMDDYSVPRDGYQSPAPYTSGLGKGFGT